LGFSAAGDEEKKDKTIVKRRTLDAGSDQTRMSFEL
jgi:hypothetical protein